MVSMSAELQGGQTQRPAPRLARLLSHDSFDPAGMVYSLHDTGDAP